MSEASESLQVRTDDAEGCIARLRESGFNGFAFRGDRGWLTVVPYGDPASEPMLPDGAAASLAATLGAPVISYSCHNDFGWGFVLALPDGRSTGFTYLDNPFGDFGDEAGAPDGADDAALDEAVLAVVVPVERVRPFLGPPSAEQAETGPGEPGKGFARAMGFPEFEWLSPAYVWDNPEDARGRGGVEVGRQPTAA